MATAKLRTRAATAMIPKHHISPNLKHMPLGDSMSHRLRLVSRGLMRSLEARISAHGIPAGSWFFLRVLWDEDNLSQSELAERTGVMGPTTFTAIRRLERLGLVTQQENRADRRKRQVRLTPAGRALEARAIPYSIEVMNLALHGLSRQEVKILRRIVDQMSANLDRDPATTRLVSQFSR